MSMMRGGAQRHVGSADHEGHALAALHRGDERRLGEAVAIDHARDRELRLALTGGVWSLTAVAVFIDAASLRHHPPSR